MRRWLEPIMRRFFVQGRLDIVWPDGGTTRFEGAAAGPQAAARLVGPRILRQIMLHPALAIGEGYMDGGIVPDGCSIYDVLDVLLANIVATADAPPAMLRLRALGQRLTRRIAQRNQRDRARRNVAHHYDIDGRIYDLFLDRDRQYSCAYFRRGDETLEQAQAAKKALVAAKLLLDRPGLEVLDIGSGWGGLALTLARDHGARVTGVTLSSEQLGIARGRAAAEGLAHLVRFELADYRTLDRAFDRVVSVGMFEHVGVGHYDQFFDVVRRCLRPDGVALLHAIGRSDGPSVTNPWIAKYIFPGGYSPGLSEVLAPIERQGLIATDIEVLRLHYARTLRLWRERFVAARDKVLATHDERFFRMFEFYLAGSELAFRRKDHMVFQIQLARRLDAVPFTRDYLRKGSEPHRQAAD